MKLLLDTNICIALLAGREADAVRRLRACAPRDVFLCSVVKAELYFGARNSLRVDENLSRLSVFFAAFESLTFDDAAAEEYGVIRCQLERLSTPIGANDLLIAAIAVRHDATLVTRNESEFRRVSGLRVDPWRA